MKLSPLNGTLILATALSFVGAGCVVRREVRYTSPAPYGAPQVSAPAEVVVTEAPPEPVIETVTVAPSPGWLWVGGAWVWHGHWVWEPWRWCRPPHPGAVWVPHRYVYRHGAHVVVRGYWR